MRTHENDWFLKANCRDPDVDPDIFFPDYEKFKNIKEYTVARAKAICAECAVREQCLNYALANHEKFGIWGGMTPEERDKYYSNRLP